jgi:hypothetical protein
MPEEMNRLLRDCFDRKASRRDFIRKAMLPPALSLLSKLYWNDSLEIKPMAERWIRRTPQFGWEVIEFPGKIRQTDGLFGLAVVAGQNVAP